MNYEHIINAILDLEAMSKEDFKQKCDKVSLVKKYYHKEYPSVKLCLKQKTDEASYHNDNDNEIINRMVSDIVEYLKNKQLHIDEKLDNMFMKYPPVTYYDDNFFKITMLQKSVIKCIDSLEELLSK